MRKCLAYLSFNSFRSGYSPLQRNVAEHFVRYPLLEYSAYHWASHGTVCNFDDTDRDIITQFFATKALPFRGNFGVWVQCLIPEADCDDIERPEPLYYAASFSLVPVIKAILDSNATLDIDAGGGRFGSTPLFVACFRGHYEVVELLLRAGADPELKDGSGFTAITFAEDYHDHRLLSLFHQYKGMRLRGAPGGDQPDTFVGLEN